MMNSELMRLLKNDGDRLGQDSTLRGVEITMISGVMRGKKQRLEVVRGVPAVLSEVSVFPTNPTHPRGILRMQSTCGAPQNHANVNTGMREKTAIRGDQRGARYLSIYQWVLYTPHDSNPACGSVST